MRDECVLVWDVFQYMVSSHVSMRHKSFVEWLSTIGGLATIGATLGGIARWINQRGYGARFQEAHEEDWAAQRWAEQEEMYRVASERRANDASSGFGRKSCKWRSLDRHLHSGIMKSL